MRIIAWVNKDSGVSLHRIINPLLLMRDTDCFITNDLREEHFEKGCDIFLYNRILPAHAVPKIKELQAKYGFKICVDIDDYWELDSHHILYQTYQEMDFARTQVQHIKEADLVFVTHERLYDEVYPFNENCYIIPNAIPKTGQFKVKKEWSEFVRLFWQGSDTHREDIELLRTPIERLHKIASKIKMIMAGYVEQHQYWYDMVMDYTAETKHQYKLIPNAPIDKYYQAYAHADICLIPLINSRFNRHKSNLKVLEAANLALPVICSNVHPYKDLPINYCKNSSDWISHIKRLVQWPKRREEEGLRLQVYADEYYNFESINEHRRQLLEHYSSVNA